jgi:nucleoside-diphosphate-sugar epimerase
VTVLLTGGAGLVGTHVLAALRARDQAARALVRPDSRSVVENFGAEAAIGDVTDPIAWELASHGITAIIHAAAIVARRLPLAEFMRVNVGGTRLAVETARRLRVPLVHVSTVAIYGRAVEPEAGGVSEDHPLQPLSEHDYYARSKRAAEAMLRQEARQGDIAVIAIRPNVIYGERDNLFTNRVIATMRRRILPRVGPGTNHLSCVYAGNVASAILAALDAGHIPGFRAYNVTRDAAPLITQREFFAEFARGLGIRVAFPRVPVAVARAGAALVGTALRVLHPGRYTGLADSAIWFLIGENPFLIDRIRAELGWNPPFGTRAAIQRATAAARS